MKLTTNEKIIYGVGLGLVALTVYIVINRKRKAKEIKAINDILDSKVTDPNKEGGQVILLQTDYDKLPIGQFPLKFGSKSKKVADLQKALNVKYNLSIDQDGKFGQSTASALCKHYFKSCFTDIQSRQYEVTNDDLTKIKARNN
jgi:hypothetical protein